MQGGSNEEPQMLQMNNMQARYVPVQASTSQTMSSSHHNGGAPPRPTPRGGAPLTAGSGGQHAPQTWSGRAHYVSSGQALSSPAHGQTGGRCESQVSASPRPGWRGQQPQEAPGDRMPAVRALVS
eukprot:4619241-Amphidinium_carterae.1